MTKWILPVMTSFLMSAIGSSAFAEPGQEMKPGGPHRESDGIRMEMRVERMHGGGGPMFFGDPEDMKAKLGLTDEQVDKIGKINNEYRKRLMKIREDMAPKMNKLHGLLSEDIINLKDVRSLVEELSKLEVEIRMLRINQVLDIENILSPDQKKQLRSSMRRMMGNIYRQQPAYPYVEGRISID